MLIPPPRRRSGLPVGADSPGLRTRLASDCPEFPPWVICEALARVRCTGARRPEALRSARRSGGG